MRIAHRLGVLRGIPGLEGVPRDSASSRESGSLGLERAENESRDRLAEVRVLRRWALRLEQPQAGEHEAIGLARERCGEKRVTLGVARQFLGE